MTRDPYEGCGNLWSSPLAEVTLDREALRTLLHATGGSIMVAGHLREICSKRLGAGIYLVSTRPKKLEGSQ